MQKGMWIANYPDGSPLAISETRGRFAKELQEMQYHFSHRDDMNACDVWQKGSKAHPMHVHVYQLEPEDFLR